MEKTEQIPNGNRHTLSLLVENKPAVLQRIAGLFARRGYNIESLAVGPTERPDYSRMTVVVRLTQKPVELVVRQIERLIPVIEVRELSPNDKIEREMVLVKVKCPEKSQSELRGIVDTYGGEIVDVSPDVVMIEATGTAAKLDALEERLARFGIAEMCRSGAIALERGFKTLDTPHLK